MGLCRFTNKACVNFSLSSHTSLGLTNEALTVSLVPKNRFISKIPCAKRIFGEDCKHKEEKLLEE